MRLSNHERYSSQIEIMLIINYQSDLKAKMDKRFGKYMLSRRPLKPKVISMIKIQGYEKITV